MIVEFGGTITDRQLFETEDPGNCAIVAVLGSMAMYFLVIRTIEGKTSTCAWGPVANLNGLIFPAAKKTGFKLEYKEFDYSEPKIKKAIQSLLGKTANGFVVEAAQVVEEDFAFAHFLSPEQLFFFNKRED